MGLVEGILDQEGPIFIAWLKAALVVLQLRQGSTVADWILPALVHVWCARRLCENGRVGKFSLLMSVIALILVNAVVRHATHCALLPSCGASDRSCLVPRTS